ncbi:FAD-binding oxidoreductase [Burkholderia cepacia]|uniref:FAD linked oxidase domain-containing protein n=1 Tax=Burkholderia cepacia GG4 TaxID=1009846 RepID=A0A9W3PC06_BURCE|nr:FAD-binding oxidoreductase [Burkholderia cepacia]AFQ51121.1 FAD linked oxidase domain-containing protein [Burkholderia cepacia GG4]
MSELSVTDALLAALGDDIVQLPCEFGNRQLKDWSGLPGSVPTALIRPRTTADVATALRVCHSLGQPIVTQGGMTGLVGGANGLSDEVALSLERMNRILEVDRTSSTITVEAGVPLQVVQEAALDAGLYFPLDLGARGSCTIGGNLATNAGGNRVIKYGMMRDQVLGIEAVLANGEVVSAMHKMIKNNSGYDLRHLLIGSEGTLGIITRTVLRLRPRPMAVATAWCALPDYDAVTTLLARSQKELSDAVTAFEVMWACYFDAVQIFLPQLRAPLNGRHPYYVLLESVGNDPEQHTGTFETFLGKLLEEGIVSDAALARSESDASAFWTIRDAPGEYMKFIPNHSGYDVSFPIVDAGRVAERCEQRLREQWPDALIIIYGHLGDGNLHIEVDIPGSDGRLHDEIDHVIYDVTREFHGSVSAEHGIGVKKKAFLGHTRSDAEITAMRKIKAALDPREILNPGKVI